MSKVIFPKSFIPEAIREFIDIEDELQSIRDARRFVGFLEDQTGQTKFTFSDLGEEEFNMLFVTIIKHPDVYRFFKLLVASMDKYLKNPSKNHDLAVKCGKYVGLNRSFLINF